MDVNPRASAERIVLILHMDRSVYLLVPAKVFLDSRASKRFKGFSSITKLSRLLNKQTLSTVKALIQDSNRQDKKGISPDNIRASHSLDQDLILLQELEVTQAKDLVAKPVQAQNVLPPFSPEIL